MNEHRCISLPYDEAESIIQEWNEDAKAAYEGCVVRVELDGEIYEFAEILNKVHADWGISKRALSIYTECGYMFTSHGKDVLVIDEVQDFY